MSNKIDERITRIRFDNDQFEKGVATSLQSIDRLKNKLDSTESVKAFEGLQKAADKTDLSGIAKAVDNISDKFSILRGVAIGVLSDIATKAISAGESMVKSLSVDNMLAGWQKYDQEVSAVQTIMVTLEDTPISEIEEALEKVGWFSDETSYSYEQMVGSMAKFISSGVSLQDATDAVIGLANASAAAGVSTKKAEHIFYNFSQAMGAGFMGLADWRSVELQNMATPEFKRNIINTALALNKIVKVGDDLYATAENLNNPDNWFSSLSMRTSLSEKWLDADVMREVLKQYEGFTDQVYKIQHDPMFSFDQASEAMKYLEDMGIALQDVSNKAFRAAQEAKTFSEAVDATKDAVSTKWKDTFKELFGNYEEAKILWTDFSESLYDLFAASGDVRNEILKQWNDPLTFLLPDQRLREAFAFPELQTGRDILIEGLWNIWNSIVNIVNAIKSAWREVFPEMTAKRLYDLTKRFRDFTARILESTEHLEGFQSFLTKIFGIFRVVLNLGKKLLGFASGFWPILKKIGKIAGTIFDQIWNFFKDTLEYINASEHIGNAIKKLTGFFTDAKNAILNFDESSIKLPTFKDLLDTIRRIKEEGLGFGEAISKGFQWIREKFEKFLPADAINGLGESIKGLGVGSSKVYETISPILTNIANLFVNLWNIVTKAFSGIISGVSSISSWISTQFKKIKLKDILAVAFMGAMSWVSIRLGIMVSRIGKIFEELSELIWSFSKLVNSTAFKIRMDALKSLGVTILMIAGAMYVFSNIKDDKIWSSVAAIAAIASALLVINFVMVKLESSVGKGSAFGINYSKESGLTLNSGRLRKTGIIALVLGVIGMVGSVLMLASFMKKNELTSDDIKKITGTILKIAGILAACSILMGLSSRLNTKLFGNNNFKLSSFYPLTIAIAMLIMVRTIKKIDEMELEHVGKVILSLIGITATIAVLGAILRKITAGAGFGMLAITASIYLILLTLNRISKMKIDLGENGPIVAVIVGLMYFLARISQLNTAVSIVNKGQKVKRTSVSIIGIVFALMGCVGAVYLLSKLSTGELIKGSIATMGLLAVLFVGLSVVLRAAQGASQFAGKGLIGISVLLLATSILITVLSVAYSLDPKSVFFASLTVAALLGMIGVMGLGLQKIGKIGGALAGIAVILGIIGGLTAALYFMLKTDLKTGLISVASMIAMILSIGVMCRLLENFSSPQELLRAFANIGYIASILFVLGTTVKILNKIMKENPSTLEAVEAMSILAISLGIMIRLLSSISIIEGKKAGMIIAMIFGICLSLFALVWALSNFVKGENLGWLKEYGLQLLALTGVIIAITAFSSLIGLAGPVVLKGTIIGVAAILIVISSIGLLIAGLYWLYNELFAKHPENLEKFKEGLKGLIDVVYLIGAVFGAGVYGFLSGAAPKAANSLSELAENLIPFSKTLQKFPNDFADNAIVFGKAIANISWYSSLASAAGGFYGIFGNKSPIEQAVKAIYDVAPYIRDSGNILSGVDLSGITNLEDVFKSLRSMGWFGLGIFTDGIGIITGLFYIKQLINGFSDIDTTKLITASTNIPLVVEIIEPLQTLVNSFGKANGVWDLIAGTNVGGFKAAIKAIANIPNILSVDEFAKLNKTTLENAITNSEMVASIIDAYTNVSTKLSESMDFWQWVASLKESQFDKFITFANHIVGYGKVLADPGNVQYVTGAVNATNELGAAFNSLVANNITDDLDALALSIANLVSVGIGEVQNFFSDEESRLAMRSAVDNFVNGFRLILAGEYQSNKIGSYFQIVLNASLDSLSNYEMNFYNKGAAIHNAFINGVLGKLTDSTNSGKSLANGIEEGATEALEINSPSRAMFEVGVNAGLGAIDGLESMEDAAFIGGGRLALQMRRGMQKTLSATKFDIIKNFPLFSSELSENEGDVEPSIIDKIINFFGGSIKNIEDGSDASISSIFTNFIENPIANGIERLQSQFDILNVDNILGDSKKELDNFLNQFAPNTIGRTLATSVSGAEITKNMFSNMPWLENMEEVVDDAFAPEITDSIIDQLFSGDYDNLFDYESYLDNFQSYYNDIYSQMSDNSIQSLFDDDQLPSSYDYQSLSRAASGGTVAGYTAEDIRALTAEIYGLEAALYSLKETMQDQHMVHSGEITVKYTNESDFIDRIQTTIINSVRREARG